MPDLPPVGSADPIAPAGPGEPPPPPPTDGWTPPSSETPVIEDEPDAPLTLWSGWQVGWIAFLLGFPGGLALAARNGSRMGRRYWAAIHLAAAALGMAVITLTPDSVFRGLAGLLNIVLPFYLYRQTESDIALLEAADRPVRTASWASGILTSLAATALFIGVVAVPLVFTGFADTAPAYDLSGVYGESFDRLPADQREQLERRFAAAVGDRLEGLTAADATARFTTLLAGGLPRLDDATLVENLRLSAAALEASSTATCAAVGRATLTGTPNPDASQTMLGSLDASRYGRLVEIVVEAVEAEARGAPPSRSASQADLDAMWSSFGGPYSAADDAVISAEHQGSPQLDTDVCTATRHYYQSVLALGPTDLATYALYEVTP
jgi:hypothetical protein